MKLHFVLLIILAIAQTVPGQATWGSQYRYLTKNGKPVYLAGRSS